MKVKTILVSQPEPKAENSPYFDLQQQQKVKIDFRPFIHVEDVSTKEIRLQKVDFSKFTAIILTSRNAVDHFFRVAEKMRFKVPSATIAHIIRSPFMFANFIIYKARTADLN